MMRALMRPCALRAYRSRLYRVQLALMYFIVLFDFSAPDTFFGLLLAYNGPVKRFSLECSSPPAFRFFIISAMPDWLRHIFDVPLGRVLIVDSARLHFSSAGRMRGMKYRAGPARLST